MLKKKWKKDSMIILLKTSLIMALLITLYKAALLITDFTNNWFHLWNNKSKKVNKKLCKLNCWRGSIVVISKVIINKDNINKVVINKDNINKVIINKVFIDIVLKLKNFSLACFISNQKIETDCFKLNK